MFQADSGFTDPTEAAELKRKRTFKKYSYRGVELDKLLDLKNEEFIDVSLGATFRSWEERLADRWRCSLAPARPRPSEEKVPARSQEEAPWIDQEAPKGQEGGRSQRKARYRQDSLARHDHRPRDDWIRLWCLRECPARGSALGRHARREADESVVVCVRNRRTESRSPPSRSSPR